MPLRYKRPYAFKPMQEALSPGQTIRQHSKTPYPKNRLRSVKVGELENLALYDFRYSISFCVCNQVQT